MHDEVEAVNGLCRPNKSEINDGWPDVSECGDLLSVSCIKPKGCEKTQK